MVPYAALCYRHVPITVSAPPLLAASWGDEVYVCVPFMTVRLEGEVVACVGDIKGHQLVGCD
jgi:hypothetical protein